jgi:flagellar biosynthesis anti-sigma factor FlgM
MRIDFTTLGVEPPDSGKPGRTGQTGTPGTAASNGPGSVSGSHAESATGLDETKFSFDQTRVQSLKTQVLAQPEIRQAKVQSLQESIGKGEYSVSSGQIADALIREVAGAQSQ